MMSYVRSFRPVDTVLLITSVEFEDLDNDQGIIGPGISYKWWNRRRKSRQI